MRKKWFLASLAIILINTPIQAQQDTIYAWDLESCIEYALRENIQIKRSRIAFEESREDTKTAEAALFPDLSFSTSQSYSNQPWIDGNTGDRNTYSGSYGLNTSWTVYNGGRRLQTIDQQKIQDRIALFNIAQTENTIEEAIAQAYIQILYAYESVMTIENTVEVSLAQVERARQLFEIGILARSDVAQLEAQYSNDKYSLISAQTALRSYKLQLKQLLELQGEEDIEVVIPEIDDSEILIPLPSKTDVYAAALALRPEIQGSLLSVESSHMSIGIARSAYMPTISLSAGLGTGHNTTSDFSFTNQIKNRWNESIGVTLSLPIFNNRQTKSAVNKAKLAYEDSKLSYLNEQKNLYSTVENLWLDATAAQERFVAALEKLNSSKISYELVSEQFDVGLRNTVELLIEMNNVLSAQQEVLQAKYSAVLNIQLLRFYQGENIEL